MEQAIFIYIFKCTFVQCLIIYLPISHRSHDWHWYPRAG